MDSSGSERGLARSLWPLPGGSGNYLRAVQVMLRLAKDDPQVTVYVQRLRRRYESISSDKAALSYMHVLQDLGFLDMRGRRVRFTPEGTRYAATRDGAVVRHALLSRIAGVRELLEEIEREPGRIGQLHARMRERGFAWRSPSQIRYRLRWLEEVGVIHAEGRARPVYSEGRAIPHGRARTNPG